MAEYRVFKHPPERNSGMTHAVLIHRYRGTWAFKDVGGWMWTHEWGFKSPLAAIRAAARWHHPDRLLRRTAPARKSGVSQ